jgi:uncharacterized protein (DUF58 family)
MSAAAGDTTGSRAASRLTRRGWTMLFSGVFLALVAYGSSLALLLYAAGFLVVLPVAAIVLVRWRRRNLAVVRTFTPRVVPAGSTVIVELAVRNLSLAPSGPATWADRLPWAPGTSGPGELPALNGSLPGYVSPGSETTLRYLLTPPVRGIYRVGTLAIEYGDPFGLATGGASLGGVQSLSVVPATVQLGPTGSFFVGGEGSAHLVQRRSTGSDDDLMTREYRSGDALRRVHWRASARHGELMVRQEEQHTYPEARLLLDTRADGYPGLWAELEGEQSGSDAFEWAVRMVASIGVHLHASGFLVHVLESAPPQIAPMGETNQGPGHDLEFLLSLAAIAPVGQRSPHHTGTPHPDTTPREVRAEGATGPIFAVLATPATDTLRWVAAQRRQGETGIAFVIGRSTDAYAALTAAGWICVPVHESDNPERVWSSIPHYSAVSADSRAGTAHR